MFFTTSFSFVYFVSHVREILPTIRHVKNMIMMIFSKDKAITDLLYMAFTNKCQEPGHFLPGANLPLTSRKVA